MTIRIQQYAVAPLAPLAELDFEVVGNTPEDFSAFIRAEIPNYAKPLRGAGVKVE